MSTKTTDKKAAQKVAWVAEEAARRKVTAEQARKMLSDLVEEVHGVAVGNIAVKEYFGRWQQRRKSELSRASVGRVADVVKGFERALGRAWEGPLAELQPGQIAAWRDGLAAKQAPATVNLSLKIIRGALRDAWRDGWLAESPAERIGALKDRRASLKQVFTGEQFSALLTVAEGEWEGIIMAGAFTGQRLSDIVRMRRSAISGVWWRFQTGKTGANMAIPLPARLLAWIAKGEGDAVFPESLATVERSGNVGALSNQFYRVMTRAGLVPARSHHKAKAGRSAAREVSALSFHSFRHTCTTWLKAQGQPESVAMAFVGHESAAVNRSYTHLPESALLSAAASMERFAG